MNNTTQLVSVLVHVVLLLLINFIGLGSKQSAARQELFTQCQTTDVDETELNLVEPEGIAEVNNPDPGGSSGGIAAVDDIPILPTENSSVISYDIITSQPSSPSQLFAGISRCAIKGPTPQLLNLGFSKNGTVKGLGDGSGKGNGKGNGIGDGRGVGQPREFTAFGQRIKAPGPVYLIVDLSNSMIKQYEKVRSFIRENPWATLIFSWGSVMTPIIEEDNNITTVIPLKQVRRGIAEEIRKKAKQWRWEDVPYAPCFPIAFNDAYNNKAAAILWVSDFIDLELEYQSKPMSEKWPAIHNAIIERKIRLYIFSVEMTPPPIIMETMKQSGGGFKML
jgi:hypothetical protein